MVSVFLPGSEKSGSACSWVAGVSGPSDHDPRHATLVALNRRYLKILGGKESRKCRLFRYETLII